MAQPDPKWSASLSPEERLKLLTELAAPYRSVRRFIYLAVGFSATIGAFVFFFRALAGRDLDTTLPSLALQLGILAAAIGLNRLENRSQKRLTQQVRHRLGLDEPAEGERSSQPKHP